MVTPTVTTMKSKPLEVNSTCEPETGYLDFFHLKGPASDDDPYDCISLIWGACHQRNEDGRGGRARSGWFAWDVSNIFSVRFTEGSLLGNR